jgi:hypothetical protein
VEKVCIRGWITHPLSVDGCAEGVGKWAILVNSALKVLFRGGIVLHRVIKKKVFSILDNEIRPRAIARGLIS